MRRPIAPCPVVFAKLYEAGAHHLLNTKGDLSASASESADYLPRYIAKIRLSCGEAMPLKTVMVVRDGVLYATTAHLRHCKNHGDKVLGAGQGPHQ
jgi:hypothetical protein